MGTRDMAYKAIEQIPTSLTAPVSTDWRVFYDTSAGQWVKQDAATGDQLFDEVTIGTLTVGSRLVDRIPVALDATDSITAVEHANRILYCTTAATLTWTLPEPTGTGNFYHFLLGVLTTGSKIIKCVDPTNTALIGGITISDGDSLFVPAGFQPGTTDDIITLNKTTTGGLLGDWVKVTDVATDVWYVEGDLHTTAGVNPATPFSST